MFFSAFPPFIPIQVFCPSYLSPVCSNAGSRLTPMQVKALLQTPSCLGPDPSLSLPFSLGLRFSCSLVFWLLGSQYPILHAPTAWGKNDLCVCVSTWRGITGVTLSTSLSSPFTFFSYPTGGFKRWTQAHSPQPLYLWAPTCPQEASKHSHLSWLEDFELFLCFWWVSLILRWSVASPLSTCRCHILQSVTKQTFFFSTWHPISTS